MLIFQWMILVVATVAGVIGLLAIVKDIIDEGYAKFIEMAWVLGFVLCIAGTGSLAYDLFPFDVKDKTTIIEQKLKG
jgi:succinate dehydrogenase hydrophobic anchor subunit